MVLERRVEPVRYRGAMYNAVAQSVLLYGSNSWVVTWEMLKVLMSFHHRVERRITGTTYKHGSGREWDYPEVEEAMDSVGVHPIGVYIKRQQTTITERVDCQPVYALCTEAERMPGMSRVVHWWYQDTVNEPE